MRPDLSPIWRPGQWVRSGTITRGPKGQIGKVLRRRGSHVEVQWLQWWNGRGNFMVDLNRPGSLYRADPTEEQIYRWSVTELMDGGRAEAG